MGEKIVQSEERVCEDVTAKIEEIPVTYIAPIQLGLATVKSQNTKLSGKVGEVKDIQEKMLQKDIEKEKKLDKILTDELADIGTEFNDMYKSELDTIEDELLQKELDEIDAELKLTQ